jgi:hypothetical protein
MFTDNRKVFLSLLSFSLLYATFLKKVTVHKEPEPINPLFRRVYHIPKPTPEEGKIVAKHPVLVSTSIPLPSTYVQGTYLSS